MDYYNTSVKTVKEIKLYAEENVNAEDENRIASFILNGTAIPAFNTVTNEVQQEFLDYIKQNMSDTTFLIKLTINLFQEIVPANGQIRYECLNADKKDSFTIHATIKFSPKPGFTEEFVGEDQQIIFLETTYYGGIFFQSVLNRQCVPVGGLADTTFRQFKQQISSGEAGQVILELNEKSFNHVLGAIARISDENIPQQHMLWNADNLGGYVTSKLEAFVGMMPNEKGF